MLKRLSTALANYLRTPPGRTPESVDLSICEEIEAHLLHAIEEHERRGVPSHEARRLACEEFGDIEQAIGGCRQVWRLDQRFCHWGHIAITAMLLIGVAYLFTTVRREVPSTTATVSGDLEGRVVDENSQPIGQAHILAVVKTWPQDGYRQQAYMTTTGRDGSFRIDDVYPTDQQYEVQLAVVADRRLLESKYVSDGFGKLDPFAFTLRPSEPIVLRFQAIDGAPLAGVEVFPHRRVDANGRDNLVYFDGSGPVVQTTKADGIARLPYFAPGDQATVCFRVPGSDWQTRHVEIPQDSELIVFDVNVPAAAKNTTLQQQGG